jgi:ankyrin repeat protein
MHVSSSTGRLAAAHPCAIPQGVSTESSRAEKKAFDILMLTGTGIAEEFGRRLDHTRQRHGGKTLALEAGDASAASLIEAFRDVDAIGPRTEIVLCVHGAMVDGRHHLKIGCDIVPTMAFLEALRAALKEKGAQSWQGRVHLYACYGAQLRQELLPGTPAWNAGECLVYGSKGVSAQQDGIFIIDEVVRCLLSRRDEAPASAHELIACAASVAGGTVAAFGGALVEPIWMPAKEGMRFLHEAYLQGEVRGIGLQQQVEAPRAAQASESHHALAAHFLGLARSDPHRLRATRKQQARVLRDMLRGRLDRAAEAIAAEPRLLLKDIVPGCSFGMLMDRLALPIDWKARQWRKAAACLAQDIERCCRDADMESLDRCISDVVRNRMPFTGEEWGRVMRSSLHAGEAPGDRLFACACLGASAESDLRSLRRALGEGLFQSLASTALFAACASGHGNLLGPLLRAGAQGDIVDEVGDSLWHTAIRHAEAGEPEAMKEWAEVFRQLRQHAVPTESLDRNGLAPLHLACRRSCLAAVRELLRPGSGAAAVNAPDSQGRSALHWAAAAGNLEIAQCLVEHGADIRARDRSNLTPLAHGLRHYRELPGLKALLRTD